MAIHSNITELVQAELPARVNPRLVTGDRCVVAGHIKHHELPASSGISVVGNIRVHWTINAVYTVREEGVWLASVNVIWNFHR